MCKAYVLRFSCSHGVLMSLESCKYGPCPVLKTTGARLPQQPYRCYNCQHKIQRSSYASTSSSTTTSRGSSCRSSIESLESNGSASSYPPPTSRPRARGSLKPCDPLPGVAVQPSGSVHLSSNTSGRPFAFSCNGSNHFITPHYSGLPTFLPHQDHACPPCQLEDLRAQADMDVTRAAKNEFPHLREEMLVRDGRVWEEWQSKPTLEKYVEEKRTEEKEMWLHVTRKWTQDLKAARVLVAEEDGLGLFA